MDNNKDYEKIVTLLNKSLFDRVDLSILNRCQKFYVDFPRCHICYDFAYLSKTNIILFCHCCEGIVHQSCLKAIKNQNFNEIIEEDEVKEFKGKYTNSIKYNYSFLCEKCSGKQSK